MLQYKPGDIIEVKGRKYKVTPKHPRQVIDTGIAIVPDPKWGEKWTPASNGLAFLAVVPVEEYDAYMENYDKHTSITKSESKKTMYTDSEGDYALMEDGSKLRL